MPPTCLIVDDSSVIRRIAKTIVQRLGLNAIDAANGREALDRCRQAMPDVIMLDWNMPVMDGLTFLTEFRRFPEAAAVKVILCTTKNDSDHIIAALAAGADEYIMKPFDDGIVEDKMRQVGILTDAEDAP